MRRVTRKPLFWIGIAGIVIGIIMAILIGNGLIPFTRLDQGIAGVFSFLGILLVTISYFQAGKAV